MVFKIFCVLLLWTKVASAMEGLKMLRIHASLIRRQLFDLLVPGSFPAQFDRVGNEVNENKVDLSSFFYTHGNVEKANSREGGKKIKRFFGQY